MKTMDCDHLACIIPVSLHDKIETSETVEDSRRLVKVTFQQRYIGSLRDDGYRKHESLGGQWVTRWSVFAGGNAVYVPPNATESDALAILLRHVEHFSFHWRMALHVR